MKRIVWMLWTIFLALNLSDSTALATAITGVKDDPIERDYKGYEVRVKMLDPISEMSYVTFTDIELWPEGESRRRSERKRLAKKEIWKKPRSIDDSKKKHTENNAEVYEEHVWNIPIQRVQGDSLIRLWIGAARRGHGGDDDPSGWIDVELGISPYRERKGVTSALEIRDEGSRDVLVSNLVVEWSVTPTTRKVEEVRYSKPVVELPDAYHVEVEMVDPMNNESYVAISEIGIRGLNENNDENGSPIRKYILQRPRSVDDSLERNKANHPKIYQKYEWTLSAADIVDFQVPVRINAKFLGGGRDGNDGDRVIPLPVDSYQKASGQTSPMVIVSNDRRYILVFNLVLRWSITPLSEGEPIAEPVRPVQAANTPELSPSPLDDGFWDDEDRFEQIPEAFKVTFRVIDAITRKSYTQFTEYTVWPENADRGRPEESVFFHKIWRAPRGVDDSLDEYLANPKFERVTTEYSFVVSEHDLDGDNLVLSLGAKREGGGISCCGGETLITLNDKDGPMRVWDPYSGSKTGISLLSAEGLLLVDQISVDWLIEPVYELR